jgi:tetratricopeptide (TPR) repeat protein
MLEGKLLLESFGMHTILSVMSRLWMTWSYAELGDFLNGERIAKQTIEIGETSKSPYSIAVSFHGMGYLNVRLSDFDQAVFYLEHGLKLCKETNFIFLLHWFMPVLGYAYTHSGRADVGISLTKEGIDRAESLGLWADQSFRVGLLGEEYLLVDRLNEAEEAAAESLRLSKKHKERGFEAWALRLLGEVHSHPDLLDAERAEDHYRQALAIASELGMRPLVAHCKSGLGALYARAERKEMACEQLAAAAEMYREMKMTYWLEKTDEALASVP